jgi:hypothetical protein
VILRTFAQSCKNNQNFREIISLEFLAHLEPYISNDDTVWLYRLALTRPPESVYQLDAAQDQTDIWLLSRHGIHIRSIIRDPFSFNAKHLEVSSPGKTISENLQIETRKRELAGLLEETTDVQTSIDILIALGYHFNLNHPSFQQELFIQYFGDIIINSLKSAIRNNNIKVSSRTFQCGSQMTREGGFSGSQMTREGEFSGSQMTREGGFSNDQGGRSLWLSNDQGGRILWLSNDQGGRILWLSNDQGGRILWLSNDQGGRILWLSNDQGGRILWLSNDQGGRILWLSNDQGGRIHQFSGSQMTREGGFSGSQMTREGGFSGSQTTREGGFANSLAHWFSEFLFFNGNTLPYLNLVILEVHVQTQPLLSRNFKF